jgi:hypothetical protein
VARFDARAGFHIKATSAALQKGVHPGARADANRAGQC